LFKRNNKTSPGGPPKLDAQVLGVAFATYVTRESYVAVDYYTSTIDTSLISGVESYGFDVTFAGVGSTYFNVGGSGEAFDGYEDYDDARIIDLLLATDSMSYEGLLYDQDEDGEIDALEEFFRTLANDVYSAINEYGDI
jgi:hypothetical protein